MGSSTVTYRGSRKHVLDWTGRPSFPEELRQIVSPVACRLTGTAAWAPRGYSAPKEARLDSFGPLDASIRAALRGWWLVHHRGANTPNWDIVAPCEIEGRPGLVLVEAKANVRELSSAGKPASKEPSAASAENHERIRAALAEACTGLRRHSPAVALSHDLHYQLSNRLAFAWKLATLGVPTVLVYLGFIGDEGIADAGAPFSTPADWEQTFNEEAERVFPSGIHGTELDCGLASMWLLVRSRDVLEQSPKRAARRRPAPPVALPSLP